MWSKTERDQHQNAIDIPIHKVLFTRFSKHDRFYDFFQSEMYMVKIREPKKRKLISDSTGVADKPLFQTSQYHTTYLLDSYSISMESIIYLNTDAYILLHGDTCRLVGEMYLPPKKLTDKIYVYYHDNLGMEDDETYILMDDKKELILMYSPPWGRYYQYDSNQKGQNYFDRVIDEFEPYFQYLWKRKKNERPTSALDDQKPVKHKRLMQKGMPA